VGTPEDLRAEAVPVDGERAMLGRASMVTRRGPLWVSSVVMPKSIRLIRERPRLPSVRCRGMSFLVAGVQAVADDQLRLGHHGGLEHAQQVAAGVLAVGVDGRHVGDAEQVGVLQHVAEVRPGGRPGAGVDEVPDDDRASVQRLLVCRVARAVLDDDDRAERLPADLQDGRYGPDAVANVASLVVRRYDDGDALVRPVARKPGAAHRTSITAT
jgi:hypothetical protein